MEVTLNGKRHTVVEHCSVNELLESVQPEGRFAVEINQNIILRSRYSETTIRPGDTIEIVEAIGGG